MAAQFWVHTCLIRRLPAPIEYLFSTPSHHRVHHDRRVHKNFGGVLIIWDRLFGTYRAPEDVRHFVCYKGGEAEVNKSAGRANTARDK